ncbi:MAG: hypothetical protein H0W13_03110 [Nitrospirales bacterium]|nr:hypothetical protein [Nitrospirales bacterium]
MNKMNRVDERNEPAQRPQLKLHRNTAIKISDFSGQDTDKARRRALRNELLVEQVADTGKHRPP